MNLNPEVYSTCVFCKKPIEKDCEGVWRSKAKLLTQYCWVDEVKGSQLHEPAPHVYKKGYNSDMKRWDILDPDGDWICSIDSSMYADALLTHLNRG